MPPLPKEHGAWAVLYGPFLLTLAALGGFEPRIVVLAIAITAAFFAHEPLSKLVRSSRHPASRERVLEWRGWLSFYLLAALVCGLYLMLRHQLWLLIPFGLMTTLLFVLHLSLIGRRQERGIWGELIGIVGLTATAPAACYVLKGEWSNECTLLWLLSLLYFASGIFYVKMRVSRFLKVAQHRKRVLHCILYHVFLFGVLVLLIGYGLIAPFLILAYMPLIIRAAVGLLAREKRLDIRRIGYTELAHAVLFVALFVTLWKSGH